MYENFKNLVTISWILSTDKIKQMRAKHFSLLQKHSILATENQYVKCRFHSFPVFSLQRARANMKANVFSSAQRSKKAIKGIHCSKDKENSTEFKQKAEVIVRVCQSMSSITSVDY